MLAGLSGSLVSHYFAERILQQEFSGRLGERLARGCRNDRSLGWWHTQASQLGPASSIRSIWDLAAAPLVELLGFSAPPATRRRHGHSPRLADRLERTRRAGRRDVERLARQPVA